MELYRAIIAQQQYYHRTYISSPYIRAVVSIARLCRYLNRCNYAYHTLDSPIISDQSYDALYDHLVALEDHYRYKHSTSPTITIGYQARTEFKQVKHLSKMYSLNKTHTYEGLIEWDRAIKKLAK